MTGAVRIRGRLLVRATVLAGAVAVGLPDYGPPGRWGPLVLAGPGLGVAVFVALAGSGVPSLRVTRARTPAVGVRVAYLAIAACFEEVFWRGLVLGGLALLAGPFFALVVSSMGFAAWHWRSLGRRCAVHLLTGAAFGAAFLAGGLTAAILAHLVYNVLVDLAVQSERARLRGP